MMLFSETWYVSNLYYTRSTFPTTLSKLEIPHSTHSHIVMQSDFVELPRPIFKLFFIYNKLKATT